MPTSLRDMVTTARASVDELSAAEANERLTRGEVGLVLDVREPDEWAEGHLPGALNVPRGMLELRADPASPVAEPILTANADAAIVVYCLKAPGARSLLAAATLSTMGYRKVVAMTGGVREWTDAGLPLETGNILRSDAVSP